MVLWDWDSRALSKPFYWGQRKFYSGLKRIFTTFCKESAHAYTSGISAILLSTTFLPSQALAQTAPVINCQGRPVTSLEFSGSFLESGTALQTNAVYRFTNVAPGVDARVQLMGFEGGGSLNTFDNDSGLTNYFQPEFVSSANSAASFRISFLTSTNIPVALDLAVSAIDVDGNGDLPGNPGSLREYAELEDSLVGYVLNGTSELEIDASGPTTGFRRFEPQTTQFAPGIDPTAEDNIATTFYTDATSIEYRIGTLGTGSGTRLTSLGFDCPNLQTPATSSSTPEDFGDAPVLNYGNPIHTLVDGIHLGATNNADSGSYDSATASGDIGDDGVSLPDFLAGEIITVDVNVTGAGGRLQAWIDWNRDGDFLDANEQVATNAIDGDADGVISLPIQAPNNLLAGNTMARFRWSTVLDVSSGEAASDGEVEDYQISLSTPTPFSCDGTLYQIATNQSTLKELSFTQVGNAYSASLQNVSGISFQVNAGWGFNELDDMIYGVRSGTKELWRVDAAGRFSLVANLTFSGSQNGSNAGDILPNGMMVYKRNNSTWTLLDLTDPLNPVSGGNINLTQNVSVIDFGLNPSDGKLYGIDNNRDQLFYVDVSGGAGSATPQFFGPQTFNGSFGAAWFDEEGNLYLYDNNTNQISMVDVGINGNGTGSSVLLATSGNDEGGINDGAYCRGPAPVPLGGISGTVFEDTDGSDALDNAEAGLGPDILVSLYYDNATPADISDDTLVRTTQTLSDGSYNFDSQVTVKTYRIEVDEADTNIPNTYSVGTTNPLIGLSVSANVTNTGQNFGFDLGAAELSAEKLVEMWDPTASGNVYAIPGNDVIYTISVTNNGVIGTDPDSFDLIDAMPPEIEFWNGDLEAGGPDNRPGSDPVYLAQASGTNMDFDYARDVRFSTQTTPPSSFADCQTLAIDGQYRSDIRYICFNPKGYLGGGNENFSVSFRARVE